jgi:hypothetical protein
MRSLVFFVACLLGCDSGGHATPDADMGIDSLYAPSLKVRGSVTLLDGTAVEGAQIMMRHSGNSLTGIETVTDAQGAYTLMLQAGFAITGFVSVEKAGYLQSNVWPGMPLTADFAVPQIVLYTQAEALQLYTAAQVTRNPARALVIARVSDGPSAIDGATVASSPVAAAYRYTDGRGTPAVSASATSHDGTAYVFDTAEDIRLSAAKSGMTFTSPDVWAPADSITYAVIARR